MGKPNRTVEVEVRNLGELLDHPMQPGYFDDLSDSDFHRLAEDIRTNGLRERIEIIAENKAGLAPGTIIDGHQRRRALLLLEFVEAEVLVRYDLARATAESIEQAFIAANLNRRQLDPLAKARAVLRLYQLQQEQDSNPLDWQQRAEARDLIGRTIGMSGRNLERYWAILNAPHAVQVAFRNHRLKLVDAARVGLQVPELQEQIAARIADGEDASAVVHELLPRTRQGTGRRFLGPALRRLATNADEVIQCWPDADQADTLTPDDTDTLRQTLERLAALLAPSHQPPDTVSRSRRATSAKSTCGGQP